MYGSILRVFIFIDRILLEKLIQPHLPVRLLCYDFKPIKRFSLGHRKNSKISKELEDKS